MSRKPDTEWLVCADYGTTRSLTLTGTTGLVRNQLITSTEISFYEDDLLLLRTVGHCKVSYTANMGVGSVNIAQRLRLVIEDQSTGSFGTAGGNLNDAATAEEYFLGEKRFRLVNDTGVGNLAGQVPRNDYATLDPWYANWDSHLRRRMKIPMALVLSTYISSATANDVLDVVCYFRHLVAK